MFSNLCEYIRQSPYHSGKRKLPVDRYTVHCYVGQAALKRGVDGFYSRPPGKGASCQYFISFDGRVGGVCDENFRSWCSSSEANDTRAITVEVASDSTKPYAFTDAAYNKLIELTVDIMKRYKKKRLVYIADKNKALKYQPAPDEMLLTLHKFFAAKACPGPWFIAKIPEFIETINKLLGATEPGPEYTKPLPGEGLYAIAKRCNISKAEIKRLNPWCTPPKYIVPMGKEVRVK